MIRTHSWNSCDGKYHGSSAPNYIFGNSALERDLSNLRPYFQDGTVPNATYNIPSDVNSVDYLAQGNGGDKYD
ncbi:hypothetical protein ACFL2V_22145 [Pseudomonadota bacterium]